MRIGLRLTWTTMMKIFIKDEQGGTFLLVTVLKISLTGF